MSKDTVRGSVGETGHLRILTTEDGRFVVACGEMVVKGPFDTNAEAWRAYDRLSGEPISYAEKRSAWVLSNMGVE